ncbi:MAG: hypothetical protein JW883_05380 [Deltaproteobacteria bacterium]|nr:hypothetical protein [Deltaproteobacteria bacterium]
MPVDFRGISYYIWTKMTMGQIGSGLGFSKDMLVKILAAVFLNPADTDRNGKKIFIQNFLGCGCPDEVVEEARIRFFARPLGALFEQRTAQSGLSPSLTTLEQDVNRLVGLPKTLKWPRRPSDELIPPVSWRRPMIEAVARTPKHLKKLSALRSMSKATMDAVIEVPGRAFFFLVAFETKRPKKTDLLAQYESGQLLYKLMGYNRCRLFTITQKDEPKIIAEIDTALTWQGLHNAFFEARHRYPIADSVLDLFDREA